MHSLRSRFPRIGMRIIKSAVAVALCMHIYYLLGKKDIPFFLVIAALQSMQPYQKNIKEITVRNVFGTVMGAFCALVVLLLQHSLIGDPHDSYFWHCLFVTLGIVLALYGSVVMGHGDAAYFTAVVYLCIVMVHLGNESSVLYVLQRLVETLIGIAVGMGINALRIPRRRIKDTLFVAALDDVLHSESSILPEYSKVELNRILDDGVRLSIITQHSSASFWEAAGSIRFKMPVILLDGAVLYVPSEKRYIHKVQLDYKDAALLTDTLADDELTILQSAVIDDSVIIFSQHVADSTKEIYKEMRRSIYRNFIHRPLPEGLPIIYIVCMGTEEALDLACERLKEAGLWDRYKIMRYRHEQPGMGYIRIFSPDADRRKAMEKLRQVCGLEKLRSFGNDSELYDVRVKAAEGESILKALKKEAEPYFWKKAK